MRNDARRSDLIERRRLVIDVTLETAAVHPRGHRFGVNAHAVEQGHVDHHAALADRLAGDAVTATTDRHEQVTLAGEVDRVHHVRNPFALDDQGRMLVNQRIPDLAGLVVCRIAGHKQRATQTLLEFHDGRVLELDLGASAIHRPQ